MMAMTREYEYLEEIIKARKQEYLLPYVYTLRLVRLKGTFFRVDDKYKYEFTRQIREDYGKYKAYIKYNRYIDNWIRELLRAPEEYCGSLIEKKRRVKTQILESEGIIIYGAGKQGDIAMRILYNEGLYDKIRCFAVSDEPKDGFMADKRVVRIEKARDCYPGSLYLLAVTPCSKAYLDMQEGRERLGIQEYLQMTDFLEKFNYI